MYCDSSAQWTIPELPLVIPEQPRIFLVGRNLKAMRQDAHVGRSLAKDSLWLRYKARDNLTCPVTGTDENCIINVMT